MDPKQDQQPRERAEELGLPVPATPAIKLTRLTVALHGLRAAWREEPGFRNHVLGALAMLTTLLVLNPSAMWWALALLCSALLLTGAGEQCHRAGHRPHRRPPSPAHQGHQGHVRRCRHRRLGRRLPARHHYDRRHPDLTAWRRRPVSRAPLVARPGAHSRQWWQAIRWPSPVPSSSSVGSVLAQSSLALGQRVRKTQPEGGAMGDGRSPCRTTRRLLRSLSGSGIGTAEISAWV
ncbi:MAG TPA: hypothetical protein EYH07_00270 [Kiloniellaceae bacterium]|nr:hypothetical protein [Kiloniellaceae bacterium]